MIDIRLLKNLDITLSLIVLVICAIGLVNLYSATYNIGTSVFKRQVLWVSIGIILAIAISLFNYKIIERYTNHLYILTILFLIAVLIAGKEFSGARSWISIGGIAFQPSELAKLSIILVMAKFFHNDFDVPPYGIVDILKPILKVIVVIILISIQPDLGTAFIIILISISVFLFAGIKTKHLIFSVIAVCMLSVPLWSYGLKDYQKTRIKSFLDPSLDPLGSGYHSAQSKIAIGSGKLSGKGFKQGTQTQLRFLPEHHTDFAFSVIGEEWGFLGSIFTILLFLLLILWILDTSSRAKDKFSMFVCYGIAAMFFWHTFINIGMVIGIFPVTGLPLLLISYGGSATLTSLLGIGLVLGIRMRKFPISGKNILLSDI